MMIDNIGGRATRTSTGWSADKRAWLTAGSTEGEKIAPRATFARKGIDPQRLGEMQMGGKWVVAEQAPSPALTGPLAAVRGGTSFLWVNLARVAQPMPADTLTGAFDIHQVAEAAQISAAIRDHCPSFLCLEFDEPEVAGLNAVAHIRRKHTTLPLLVITSRLSEAVANWALRIRVWDLLVKPVSHEALERRIASLLETARRRGPRTPPEALNARLRAIDASPASAGFDTPGRTDPAVAHVAAHFHRRITLDEVAALNALSARAFSRVFKREHGMSFGDYLLGHRIEHACERLLRPGACVKQVAYSVGFNDLSYFTQMFKREVGICPSAYRATAKLS